MIVFASDMFAEHYRGGAELTTEAIITNSLFPVNKIMCRSLTPEMMEHYKSAVWVFGNFSDLSDDSLLYALKNLNYIVLEYDYKFCSYRSIKKHELAAGKCECESSRRGKLVSLFLHSAQVTWWMSQAQLNKYQSLFPFLSKNNNQVLSSVFSDDTLAYIQALDTADKTDKWLILNSPSWIKGAKESIAYAEENNLEYELVWDIPHTELLDKLAKAKGIIFFPQDADTCPRMTIEARLLGCEIISNDNVQHKDEEWFANKESTLQYLKERTSIFWKNIENATHEHLNIPAPATNTKASTAFKVVVPFYNAEQWIGRTINSLKDQRYENFECMLIDDMSDDNSIAVVENLIAGDSRFRLKTNDTKKYALHNIVDAISDFSCNDEDVVILLDGDDWLASTTTLGFLNETYGDALMTYGSYVFNPTGQRGPEPSAYPLEVIENNTFRGDIWRASHLRTFKYKLWTHLKTKDLQDANGDYYQMTYDQAIMLPLLELSGEKTRYISRVLHVYNKENPLNVDKIKAQRQVEIAQEIRSKEPYSRL